MEEPRRAAVSYGGAGIGTSLVIWIMTILLLVTFALGYVLS